MKKIFTAITFILLSGFVFAQVRIYTPEQVAPENGETGQNPNVYVNWNAVTGGTLDITYEMWLDIDPDFPNPLDINTSFSAYQTDNLFFGQEYYWKVRASDGIDTSYWSPTWSFMVLSMVELDKPSNNSDGKEPEEVIKWDSISGVTKYLVQYDTSFYWENQFNFNEEDLNDVSAIDLDNAWAVGNAGLMMYYDGMGWMIDETYETDDDLFAVAFNNFEMGFAGGEGGLLLSYSAGVWEETEIDDGGSPYNGDIFSLLMISDVIGFAGCESGDIAMYDGTDWIITDQIDDDVVGLSAVNENMVWAVCLSGKIYKYDGAAWTEEFDAGMDMFGISFVDENNGWAAGEKGSIAYFNGTEWTLTELEPDDDLLAIVMTGAMSGYAFGDDENIFIYNGTSWMNNTSGTAAEIYGVSLGIDGSGWAVGEEGAILKFNGTAFDSPFSTTIGFLAPSKEDTLKLLPFGKNIYWRMKAIHALDTSSWSFPFAFQVLDSVELKTPTDTSTNQFLRNKFKWDALDGVAGYKLQISDNPEFTNADEVDTDSNAVFASGEEFGKMYYWRVKAYHAEDESMWNSFPYCFTTTNTVMLSEPENNEVGVPRLPLFEWDSIPGVMLYRIQYNTTPDFSAPCCSQLIGNGTPRYQVNFILAEDQQIWWRVKALTAIDSSEWSEVWTCTTEGGIGIDENFEERLTVYPNPSNGLVNIEFNLAEPAKIRLSIMDLLGQSYSDRELQLNDGLNREQLNASELANGIYLIRIEKEGEIFTRKLILDK